MLKTTDKMNLDWVRGKTAEIKRRGNVVLVAAQLNSGNTGSSKANMRCVWPNRTEVNESKYLSRRVWGR